jgi:DNA-directed RNA polymerase sigma subunit (sigma70/sigma32)
MNIDEKANDIRHMFEARLITRKEYGELIRKLETEFRLRAASSLVASHLRMLASSSLRLSNL